MPKGIYKHKKQTEENKKKISLANKGHLVSEETKRKIGLANAIANKGKKLSEDTKRKIGLSNSISMMGNKNNLGRKFSEETKRKISLAHKKIKHHKQTEKTRKKISEINKKRVLEGKHNFWRGGKTLINKKIRSSLEYSLWREAVFKRDNYTCIWCGARSGNGEAIILNADHIKPFSLFPELRFAIDNGRTLCIDCHRKTETYGIKSLHRKCKEV
jgi:hypothetical protein